jgi:hypothetical protein
MRLPRAVHRESTVGPVLTQQYACPWECIRAELLHTRIQGGFLWGAHLSPQLSFPQALQVVACSAEGAIFFVHYFVADSSSEGAASRAPDMQLVTIFQL